MSIENTSEREPIVHLAGMIGGNSSDYIEDMEAQGQRQFVNSTSLPTKISSFVGNTPAEAVLESMGFTLGPVHEHDPLFREATLPPGWSKQGTDHAMHSHIVDEKGRERISIFYKAAFYDRCADGQINSPYGALNKIISDRWYGAETDAERDHSLIEYDFTGWVEPEYVEEVKNLLIARTEREEERGYAFGPTSDFVREVLGVPKTT